MSEKNYPEDGFNDLLSALASKPNKPQWLNTFVRTLQSRDVTLETWNSLINVIANVASDTVSISDFLQILYKNCVWSVKGSANPEEKIGNVILELSDFGINIDASKINKSVHCHSNRIYDTDENLIKLTNDNLSENSVDTANIRDKSITKAKLDDSLTNEIDGKVNKIPTGDTVRVYVSMPELGDTFFRAKIDAEGSAFVYRDVYGRAKFADPLDIDDASNKNYVDTKVSESESSLKKYVDNFAVKKYTDKATCSQAYIKAPNGSQTFMNITSSSSVQGWNIMARDTSGRSQIADPDPNNATDIANVKFVKEQVAGIVNSAPSTLDTLQELAAALNNDQDFANNVLKKLDSKSNATNLENGTGKYSLQMGLNSASGENATALGSFTEASGNTSVATGYGTKVTADNAFASGYNTVASGKRAQAHGHSTVASGNNSYAGGKGTVAKEENQTVVGQYNADNPDALFIVGNGSEGNESNAFEVLKDGTAKLGDDLIITRKEFDEDLNAKSNEDKAYTNKTHYGYSGDDLLIIPEGTTTVGGYSNTNYKCVVIPDSVTSIDASAFSYCSGLTSIKIPESVTTIGEDAFRGCTGLTSITIPDGVASIVDSAFSGCSGLTKITIPDSVTSIGDYAFYNCPLKVIDLTAFVTEDFPTIGRGAFTLSENSVIKVIKGRKEELSAMANRLELYDYIVEVETADTAVITSKNYTDTVASSLTTNINKRIVNDMSQTTYTQAYCKSNKGGVDMFDLRTAAVANTIPVRDSNGAIKVGMAQSSDTAVPRSYVDGRTNINYLTGSKVTLQTNRLYYYEGKSDAKVYLYNSSDSLVSSFGSTSGIVIMASGNSKKRHMGITGEFSVVNPSGFFSSNTFTSASVYLQVEDPLTESMNVWEI